MYVSPRHLTPTGLAATQTPHKKQFLKSIPPLAIYLAGNSSIIASASIPLAPLISSVNFSGHSEISGRWSVNRDQTIVSHLVGSASDEAFVSLSVTLEQVTRDNNTLPKTGGAAAVAAGEMEHQQRVSTFLSQASFLSWSRLKPTY